MFARLLVPVIAIALVICIHHCETAVLTSNKVHAVRGETTNYTLHCSTSKNMSLSAESSLSRMRVLRQDSDGWISVIEMDTDWEEVQVKQDGLVGKGYVIVDKVTKERNVRDLWVTWPLITNDAEGYYKCDVLGYGDHEEAMAGESEILHLKVLQPLNNERLFEIIHSKQDSFCNSMLHEVEDMLGAAASENRQLKDQMDNFERELESISVGYFDTWPIGMYSLPQPDSGCPMDAGVVWKTGWRRHHTESSFRNADYVSKHNHLKKPVLGRVVYDNFMTQNFCSVTQTFDSRVWPLGQYCIMRFKNNPCPAGFTEGSIFWDDEDHGNKNTEGGVWPGSMTADTVITYCCRDDRSPDVEIKLPTSRAFYLFRYRGQCQAVKNMALTEEFIHFDADCCDSFHNGTVPDGMNRLFERDVALQLCYYAPVEA